MRRIKELARKGLAWGERTFNVDTIYIARGGFWTGFKFMAGLMASIASMVAFGNLLSKDNYGTYNYLISLGSTLAFLTLTGVGPAVVRAVARGKESLIGYALKLELKYNLLATLTVGAAALYYYIKGNMLFSVSLLILAWAVPMEAAYHLFEHVLIGRKRFDTLAIATSLSAIASAIGTITVLFFTKSVLILILVYSVLSFGPSFIIYLIVTKNARKEKPEDEDAREIRSSAFHITSAGLVGALAQYVDKITLFHFAGPVALATYGFATAGPDRLKGVSKDWVNIALPRLANRDLREIHSVFYKRLGLSMLAGLTMALVYIFIAPIFFKLLLPKYLDSILYSQIYALGLILIPGIVYMGNIFYSQNMLRAIYITSIGGQIARIALFIIFGWLWQTWGLVFAFLLNQIISTILGIYVWEMERLRLSKLSHL